MPNTVDAVASSEAPISADQAPADKSGRSASIDDVAASMLTRPEDGRGAAREPEDRVGTPNTSTEPASSGDRSSKKPSKQQDDASDDERAEPVDGSDDDDDALLSYEDDEEDDQHDDSDASLLDDDDASEERGDEDDDLLDAPTILGDEADEQLVSVTVDGEEQQVPLSELRRRYAGEGAIEKRLQEATERRDAANTLYDNTSQVVHTALQKFGEVMFRRVIPEPDEALRMSRDPRERERYLLQVDAYRREGEALDAQKAELQKALQQADATKEQEKAARRQEAALELRKRLPVLKDPKKGPIAQQRILEAAEHFGFSKQEITECTDPRLFQVMLYAGIAQRMGGKSKVKVAKPAARTLANKASKSQKQVSSKRQNQAVTARARQTGDPADVAMTMIERPRKNRRG